MGIECNKKFSSKESNQPNNIVPAAAARPFVSATSCMPQQLYLYSRRISIYVSVWRDITVKALKHCGKIYWKKIKSSLTKKKEAKEAKRRNSHVRHYREKEHVQRICSLLFGLSLLLFLYMLYIYYSNAAFFRYHHGVRSEWEGMKWKKINKKCGRCRFLAFWFFFRVSCTHSPKKISFLSSYISRT